MKNSLNNNFNNEKMKNSKLKLYFSVFNLIFATLFCLSAFAQLKADAGEDKIICSDEFAVEIEIGGSPTASGGVEPYTYLWFGKFVGTEDNEPIVYDLGRMLDDSTKSNPTTYLHDIPEKWTALYLKVEDATGQIAYDTLNFIRAGIWKQLLYPNFQYIVKGDSVKLIKPYLDNPLTPISYLISPAQGLTDSTDINGWAKPGYSTNYSIQAINSLGCVSGKFDYMHIKVVDAQTDSVYKAMLDSVSNLLVGEWEWCDSGGGLGGNGFGHPEENGYTVNVIVEKDEFSDSLLFRSFINDTMTNQGKANFHFFQNNPSVFEINSIIPEIHDLEFINPCFEDGPCDPDRMIHVEFFNKDSVRFYHEYCSDCFEVYYKRLNPTGIVVYNIPDLNISFYPNPATNQITISNPCDIKIKKIEIFDLSGRVAKKWDKWEPEETILKLESFKPGIYLLKIETEPGIITEKLIVE